MRRLFLLACLLLAACAGSPRVAVPSAATRPPVILVSIDGFRAEYLARGLTPNISALAAAGVRATAMRPSFPSITFPNHYALVTGFRPDRNGIVNNDMDDPAMPGVRFSMSNRPAVADGRWWDDVDPVWVTAEKAGRRTATMFWPGSEAEIHGVRPAQWLVFDGAMPDDTRVDTLLGWLDAPQRFDFLTLYFDGVDHAGHDFGPDSAELNAALAAVDARIGRLRAGLAARGVTANIIIVSDHGMTANSADRVIRIDRLLPHERFAMIGGWAMAGVTPVAGQDAAVAAALIGRRDHMQCWRKADFPRAFHYGSHRRVPPILCLADAGWVILDKDPTKPIKGGTHGYDNRLPDMAAIFVANGPAFRPGTTLPVFDNVDVHPLLLRLLGLPPRASQGRIAPLQPALR
jgi:ectonucleotide pyrophosphatase/phosphodiesterase family protein 5